VKWFCNFKEMKNNDETSTVKREVQKWQLGIIGLVMMAALMGVSSASNIILYSNNYTSMSSTPSDIAMANAVSPYTVNASWGFSPGTGVTGNWNITNSKGMLIVGGLSPAVKTSYYITLDINRTNWNSYVNIVSGNMYVIFQRSSSNAVIVYQYYQRPNGTNGRQSFITTANYPSPVTLQLDFDGYNQSYTVTVGSYNMTSTLNQPGVVTTLPYEIPSTNTITFQGVPTAAETNETLVIHSINQSIIKNGNITSIGDPLSLATGVDGPQNPLSTWHNGSLLISANNGRATIWADPNYLNDPDVVSYTKTLLSQGWELGEHETVDLGKLNTSEAEKAIDSNTTAIISIFNQTPTSFCSLQDNESWENSNYAYTKYGMISRNGYTGVKSLPNIGNLENATWDGWWSTVQPSGIIYRSFTHQTDVSPAIAASIDPSKYNSFVTGYSAKNTIFVPFIDWWKMSTNTNDAAFIENTDPNALLNFTAHTNGYPALVEVNITYNPAYTVRNVTDGTEVFFRNATDGNMAFYVSNGSTYYVTDAVIPVAFHHGKRSEIRK